MKKLRVSVMVHVVDCNIIVSVHQLAAERLY